MEGLARTAATADQQRRWLLWTTGCGLLAGILLWSFLSGIVVRALPEGWHLPEQMAANIVGGPTMWSAGIRLLHADNPQAWAALDRAAVILRENREAIETCERETAQTTKLVRCTINISAGSTNAGGS
jgi:hypothetical protein